MKAAADSTLAEVRRKLAEATKGLETLNMLVKLRDIRKERADQKGECHQSLCFLFMPSCFL